MENATIVTLAIAAASGAISIGGYMSSVRTAVRSNEEQDAKIRTLEIKQAVLESQQTGTDRKLDDISSELKTMMGMLNAMALGHKQ